MPLPHAPKCTRHFPTPCLGRQQYGHKFEWGEAVWYGDSVRSWLWLHDGHLDPVTICPWCQGELPDMATNLVRGAFLGDAALGDPLE